MKQVNINFSNKMFYTLVVMMVFVLGAIGVIAYGGSQPSVVGHSAGEIEGALVSGAVVAFNLASCPPGWSEYTSARDRTIIGSGSSYSRGATGGASTHILTIAEMPSHSHADQSWSQAYQGWSGVGMGAPYSTNTGSTGGSQPHNNMQPYIALLYCVKN